MVAIQYLRAIAAIAVVVFHLSGQVRVLPIVSYATSAMDAGVDLFFVISGFVMAWTLLNGRKLSAGAFIGRRLARILPLYWLVTSFMLMVLLIAPELMRTTKLAWPHVIASYLFIPAVNPATGIYQPLAIPGWTLNYEMAFYLIFAGAIAAAGSDAKLTVGFAWGTLAMIVTAGWFWAPGGAISFYVQPILLEFALGMGAAVVLRRASPVPPVALVGLTVLAGLCLFWPDGVHIERLIRRGIPATFVIISAAWLVVPSVPLLKTLGDASYSIYLSHIVTVSVVMKLAAAGHLLATPERRAATLIGGSIACVVVGVVIWHVIERPLTTAVRRWFSAGVVTRGIFNSHSARSQPGQH